MRHLTPHLTTLSAALTTKSKRHIPNAACRNLHSFRIQIKQNLEAKAIYFKSGLSMIYHLVTACALGVELDFWHLKQLHRMSSTSIIDGSPPDKGLCPCPQLYSPMCFVSAKEDTGCEAYNYQHIMDRDHTQKNHIVQMTILSKRH